MMSLYSFTAVECVDCIHLHRITTYSDTRCVCPTHVWTQNRFRVDARGNAPCSIERKNWNWLDWNCIGTWDVDKGEFRPLGVCSGTWMEQNITNLTTAPTIPRMKSAEWLLRIAFCTAASFSADELEVYPVPMLTESRRRSVASLGSNAVPCVGSVVSRPCCTVFSPAMLCVFPCPDNRRTEREITKI